MSPGTSGAVLGILLDSSVRALAVAALVAVLLRVARVRAGNLRHAAWATVLAAMLLMPGLTLVLATTGVRLPAPVPVDLASSAGSWLADDPALPAIAPDDSNLAAPTSSAAFPSPTGRTVAVTDAGAALERPQASWPAWLMIAYLPGVVLLLARLMVGWRLARRVTATARRVPGNAATGSGAPLLESDLVAAPVVLGMLRPRILLPAAWRTWPAGHLEAVLAHEQAHARRRDPLVALVAHLNRCIFWFHPLAWWLERAIAAAAEQAADADGLRAAGEARRYAKVLVDMAAAVRGSGRRLSWQGVRVDGSGLLGDRIDRILRGDCCPTASRPRTMATLAVCATAVVLVAACRTHAPEPSPLQPDPEAAADRAAQAQTSGLFKEADAMTSEQVRELEARVANDPQDFEGLRKLLVFYRPVSVQGPDGRWAARCTLVIGEQACVEARRPHILRIIRDHPEHEMAGEWGARIFSTRLDPLPDPNGYQQATALWLAHLKRKNASAELLLHAARFFEVGDERRAEEALVRAAALDPQGRSTDDLGRLYYLVLVGSSSSTPLNVVRTIDSKSAHGPHANDVRRRLEESSDPRLLAATAFWLLNQGGGYQRDRLDFDPIALGRAYLERALSLDPEFVRARALRVSLAARERDANMRAAVKGARGEEQHRAVSALPETERFEYLPWLGELAYMGFENAEDKGQEAEATLLLDLSKKYAQELLVLAPRFADHPEYGSAVFRGHITAGTVALRRGDREAAVEHLMAASKAPASEELAYGHSGLHGRLVNYLLKAGERESVAAFLERYAALNVVSREQLQKDAERIRKGVMPLSYQYMVTGQ